MSGLTALTVDEASGGPDCALLVSAQAFEIARGFRERFPQPLC